MCTLEWLSHNGLSVSGFSYYRFSIEIPAYLILECTIATAPKEWRATPATDKTRDFADKYLFNSLQYLAMAVPSVMVPEEKNLIINPMHPSFSKISKTILSLGKYSAPLRASLLLS